MLGLSHKTDFRLIVKSITNLGKASYLLKYIFSKKAIIFQTKYPGGLSFFSEVFLVTKMSNGDEMFAYMT